MKTGKLKRQRYTLLNISKLGMANGTPLVCEDCGATIFNIATIKGQDSVEYTVGLTCLKKLLKYDTVIFSKNELIKMSILEKIYDKAINTLKFVNSKIKEMNDRKYTISKYEYEDGSFCLCGKKENGRLWFETITLDKRTLPFFINIINK